MTECWAFQRKEKVHGLNHGNAWFVQRTVWERGDVGSTEEDSVLGSLRG